MNIMVAEGLHHHSNFLKLSKPNCAIIWSKNLELKASEVKVSAVKNNFNFARNNASERRVI